MNKILEKRPIVTSAPCRVDMGGTLDIRIFYYNIPFLTGTFNIALGLRTKVTLMPYKNSFIKITCSGIDTIEYKVEDRRFDHSLGFISAIASYFLLDGVHIVIESSSPPQSGLGGSSSAGVALIKACTKLKDYPLSKTKIAKLAWIIEENSAMVPCGMQDHLAAVYGGVNVWYWHKTSFSDTYTKNKIIGKRRYKKLEDRLLVAYCGKPHVSKDINSRWIEGFISGETREIWEEIALCADYFVNSIAKFDLSEAISCMRYETYLRLKMTPDVLDEVGKELVDEASYNRCGARFTGAGQGGCVWAIGEPDKIDQLRPIWESIIDNKEDACILDAHIDSKGVIFEK